MESATRSLVDVESGYLGFALSFVMSSHLHHVVIILFKRIAFSEHIYPI